MRDCHRALSVVLALSLLFCALPVFAVAGFSVTLYETYASGPSDQVNIRFGRVAKATEYEVWRASPMGEFQLFKTVGGTSATDTRPAASIYRYKVRPVMTNGVKGAFSEEKTVLSGLPSNITEPGAKSGTRILLILNKAAQVLTAYIKDDDGRFTVPIRHMITSTGAPDWYTPVGTFRISTRSQWYQYPNGTFIRYPVKFGTAHGMTLYVHSVLYDSKKKLINSSVGRLGTRQSLGCVRLTVNDALWVYDQCASGTTLIIREGKGIASLTGRLRPKNTR